MWCFLRECAESASRESEGEGELAGVLQSGRKETRRVSGGN